MCSRVRLGQCFWKEQTHMEHDKPGTLEVRKGYVCSRCQSHDNPAVTWFQQHCDRPNVVLVQYNSLE